MKSLDDYRLLRLTEPQKAVFGPDNASKHIRIVLNTFVSMIDVFGVLLGHLPASKRPETVRNGQMYPYVARCCSGIGNGQVWFETLDTRSRHRESN